MKTINIILYSFDELSSEAKAVAVSNFKSETDFVWEDGKVKDAFKIERKTQYGSSLADKESTGEHDWKPTTREEFEAVRQQALICFNKPLSIKKTIEVEVSY